MTNLRFGGTLLVSVNDLSTSALHQDSQCGLSRTQIDAYDLTLRELVRCT